MQGHSTGLGLPTIIEPVQLARVAVSVRVISDMSESALSSCSVTSDGRVE